MLHALFIICLNDDDSRGLPVTNPAQPPLQQPFVPQQQAAPYPPQGVAVGQPVAAGPPPGYPTKPIEQCSVRAAR
ncbi:hypothetical protein HT031_002473 [Scenedesmus sp. PABB004]|nr:hypothetical protein HT031_002473 [Scenedesmus sp. PABB004]